MNLFWLSPNRQINAEWHVDSHVRKIILEATQLLCTAYRVLDGTLTTTQNITSGRQSKVWKLEEKDIDQYLYKATHVNHGCSKWVRESIENYMETCHYGIALCEEFEYRFDKEHKCINLLGWLGFNPPKNLPRNIERTKPYLAMPDQYKTDDVYQSYRNYYVNDKTHLRKYTNREVPEWFQITSS